MQVRYAAMSVERLQVPPQYMVRTYLQQCFSATAGVPYLTGIHPWQGITEVQGGRAVRVSALKPLELRNKHVPLESSALSQHFHFPNPTVPRLRIVA
jgi:hypothetical protein